MAHQFILDEKGETLFAVVPIDEYNELKLYRDLIENEEEDGEFVDIPYEKGSNDEETVPNDIVNLMVEHDISLLAAWRLYRGLSQSEVALKAGLTQSAISQVEKQNSKPQQKTLERLAKIYDCRPTQLYLYD